MEELRYSKKRIRIYIGTLLGVILAIGLIIVCNHCVSEKKSDSKYNESIETNGSILNNIVLVENWQKKVEKSIIQMQTIVGVYIVKI